ncbi:MAG: phosphotransferase [Planctomycetes bacterium]|nr:phosphotransferase [Planctomycetota bacterium]MCB9887853.1 phosphotransferase [Planctomycetota bacterium]
MVSSLRIPGARVRDEERTVVDGNQSGPRDRQVRPHYTLVESVVTRIPSSQPAILGAAQWPAGVEGLPEFASLGGRELGEPVTDHCSSWVRRLPHASGAFYVKTYDFPTWRSRLAAVGRRPLAAWTSRARREFSALQWLRNKGFAAPEPIAVATWRRCGLLARAVLVTRELPGERCDVLLSRLPEAAPRRDLAAAIGRFVAALHASGWRDRNLDLRNLLALHGEHGWQLAKLDSPRFRLRAAGRADDRLARADWQRLLPQLPDDLAAVARAAAHESRQRSTSSERGPVGA